jgi:hypothetical protein
LTYMHIIFHVNKKMSLMFSKFQQTLFMWERDRRTLTCYPFSME